MADMPAAPAILLHQLAGLDAWERREVATIVRRLSENLAEVPDRSMPMSMYEPQHLDRWPKPARTLP
jgi:hypothetical protein